MVVLLLLLLLLLLEKREMYQCESAWMRSRESGTRRRTRRYATGWRPRARD